MANVNEGERWTITGMYESTLVRIDSGRTLDRDESVEVVPAKALREAKERAGTLEAALEDARDCLTCAARWLPDGERRDWLLRAVARAVSGIGPSPSAPAGSSVSEPEAGLDGTERCGRLLVGQGDDTYDPECVRPAGHLPPCRPEGDARPAHRESIESPYLGAPWTARCSCGWRGTRQESMHDASIDFASHLAPSSPAPDSSTEGSQR